MNGAAPVFGTYEWTRKTANCMEGCHHDCLYCYARAMAARFRHVAPETKWRGPTTEAVRRGTHLLRDDIRRQVNSKGDAHSVRKGAVRE